MFGNIARCGPDIDDDPAAGIRQAMRLISEKILGPAFVSGSGVLIGTVFINIVGRIVILMFSLEPVKINLGFDGTSIEDV